MAHLRRKRNGSSITAFDVRVAALGVTLVLAACGGAAEETDGLGAEVSLYALTSADPGVYLYPPLGPEPSPTGIFDAGRLGGLQVVLEATDTAGNTSTLGTFDRTSSPALVLLAAHELYFVNVPAARYFTDPSLAYRFRILENGREIAFSDLSPHIFTVLRYVPQVPVGVKVRLERTTITASWQSEEFYGRYVWEGDRWHNDGYYAGCDDCSKRLFATGSWAAGLRPTQMTLSMSIYGDYAYSPWWNGGPYIVVHDTQGQELGAIRGEPDAPIWGSTTFTIPLTFGADDLGMLEIYSGRGDERNNRPFDIFEISFE